MSREREFFRLAGTWLACRYCLMGGILEGHAHCGREDWNLLGMLDFAAEMKLLCAEIFPDEAPV